MIANATVRKLAIQPMGSHNLKGRLGGNRSLVLFLNRSTAAGIANVTCCKISPVPMKALNAVEEARYIQPIMNITDPLTTSAQTGTSSFGCIRPMNFEPIRALSRAKDHVNREAV